MNLYLCCLLQSLQVATKNLSTVSKDQKQAAVNSPERKRTTAQVVKETKQNKISNKEEHSTGSDSTDLPVTQVNTTLNLSSMADSRLDAKMEHLLIYYFLAKGNNHKIRKMFREWTSMILNNSLHVTSKVLWKWSNQRITGTG